LLIQLSFAKICYNVGEVCLCGFYRRCFLPDTSLAGESADVVLLNADSFSGKTWAIQVD